MGGFTLIKNFRYTDFSADCKRALAGSHYTAAHAVATESNITHVVRHVVSQDKTGDKKVNELNKYLIQNGALNTEVIHITLGL